MLWLAQTGFSLSLCFNMYIYFFNFKKEKFVKLSLKFYHSIEANVETLWLIWTAYLTEPRTIPIANLWCVGWKTMFPKRVGGALDKTTGEGVDKEIR